MDSCKWSIAELILAFALVVLGASQLDDREETIETSVWVGEEVDLECGDNSSDSAFRFWKKGDNTLILGNGDITDEDRISLLNWSAILRIANVTLADEGHYTCTVYTMPRIIRTTILQVKVMSCVGPKRPLDGGYESDTVSAEKGYKINDKIRYYCDPGFVLVGVASLLCTGSPKGWNAPEPYCEPKYITQLKQRLDTLEDKMATINDTVVIVDNRTTINEIDVANIDEHVTSMSNILTSIVFLASGMNTVKNQMSKAGQLAAVRLRYGRFVSEFTWTVENIEDEIVKAKGNQDYSIQSTPFYVNVPGYRVRLRLQPNDRNKGYLGIYVGMVKGEFDNILSWPFSSQFEFTSVSPNGSQIASVLISPSTAKECSISFLKPPQNKQVCGFAEYIESETLLSNKDEYLINGSLSIEATFF